jgi:hypothetical protein
LRPALAALAENDFIAAWDGGTTMRMVWRRDLCHFLAVRCSALQRAAADTL